MIIANPIYDVVFKYLMDDQKIAKLIISSIIGKEIESIEFGSTERRVVLPQRSLTVFHIDFSAKIKTENGEIEQVIIEIQKAKLSTDIMRFRGYLGHQYADKNNFFMNKNGKKSALPIVSIYFLGHSLKHTNAPIVSVERTYRDISDRSEIKKREEFIESLSHDSFIIQIPKLKKKCRNDLEKLLNVFNQKFIFNKDHHQLLLKEDDYPEKYKMVTRRLLKALEEPKVRETMEIEDEVLEDLESLEREIAEKSKTLEENRSKLKEETRLRKEAETKIKDLELQLKKLGGK